MWVELTENEAHGGPIKQKPGTAMQPDSSAARACCHRVMSQLCFLPRNEDEMYKILLNDYEYRQKQILMENAELKKVLQQMKKEMISLLSPQKKKPRERAEDGTGTVVSVTL